jgi:hypothetical protein
MCGLITPASLYYGNFTMIVSTVCYTMNRGGSLGMTMHLPGEMRKPENKGVDREDAARKKVQE